MILKSFRGDILSNRYVCAKCYCDINVVVLQAENGDKVNSWFIFDDCFQVEEAEKNLVMMEIPTLSQLQQSTLDMPSQSAAISRYKSIAFATVRSEIMKPSCGEMLCDYPKSLQQPSLLYLLVFYLDLFIYSQNQL